MRCLPLLFKYPHIALSFPHLYQICDQHPVRILLESRFDIQYPIPNKQRNPFAIVQSTLYIFFLHVAKWFLEMFEEVATQRNNFLRKVVTVTGIGGKRLSCAIWYLPWSTIPHSRISFSVWTSTTRAYRSGTIVTSTTAGSHMQLHELIAHEVSCLGSCQLIPTVSSSSKLIETCQMLVLLWTTLRWNEMDPFWEWQIHFVPSDTNTWLFLHNWTITTQREWICLEEPYHKEVVSFLTFFNKKMKSFDRSRKYLSSNRSCQSPFDWWGAWNNRLALQRWEM